MDSESRLEQQGSGDKRHAHNDENHLARKRSVQKQGQLRVRCNDGFGEKGFDGLHTTCYTQGDTVCAAGQMSLDAVTDVATP